MRAAAASTSSRKIWPASISSVPSGAQSLARRLEMVAVVVEAAAAERSPAAFHRAIALVARRAAAGQRLGRRIAEELRRIGQLGISLLVAEQFVDRRIALLAEHIPQRHLDARPGVRGLQQVHAFELDGGSEPVDVGRRVDLLAEHHRLDRLAGAVRHRRDIGGDRGQRRRLAFAPAGDAVGGDAHEQARPGCRRRYPRRQAWRGRRNRRLR